MTRRIRTILFLILAILFFLVAPAAVFYSQGYRFDLEKKKVSQTGAFYFKILPKTAGIYLQDKLVKKTDFLFGTAFIDNLLPKKYKIEIKKEGYQSWQKNLEIKEKFTTEVKNVFLVPGKVKFEILDEKIEDFLPSPDNKKIIVKKRVENNWALSLFDLEKNNQSLLFETKDIFKKDEKVEGFDLIWSTDSKRILIKVISKEQKYFILELDREKKPLGLDFLGKDFTELSFDPKNSQRIWFMKKIAEKNSLFSADYGNREISQPILENLISYQISNGNIYWLGQDGFLYQSDLSGRKIKNFNQEPFPLKDKAKYQIMVFEEKIFLKENDNFYFFNEKGKSFEKILDGVEDVKISSDLKKIIYFTNNEIWILFLKEIEDEQPQRKEGERLFLTRFSEKIGDVFWWTSHYLIFNAGNNIKIAEIDDRDKINIYELTKFPSPEIFWNKIDKKLYILSEGNFYSSEKLIP